jgi:hypothetical protein
MRKSLWKIPLILLIALVTALAVALPSYAASWTVVPTPNATTEDWLSGVAAFSPSDLWSVGTQYKRPGLTGSGGLIEQYNGTSWQVVSSPTPTGCVYCSLTGVSGSSASDVWAVGKAWFNKVDYDGLIEHYNGNSWSLVSDTQPSNGYLNGVTSVSSADAWAVGILYNSSNAIAGPLLEHYDGTAWTATTTSLAPGGILTSVMAVSASDVWAVGNDQGAGLVMNYNGTSWTQVPVPAPSGSAWNLTGVSATSASDVWVVGYTEVTGTNSGTEQPIAEHFNGTSWTLTYLPQPTGYTFNGLSTVLALSSTSVWATGWVSTYNSSVSNALFEYFNGTSWSLAPAPSLSGYDLGYSGLASTGGVLWATGTEFNFADGILNQTSTAEYP